MSLESTGATEVGPDLEHRGGFLEKLHRALTDGSLGVRLYRLLFVLPLPSAFAEIGARFAFTQTKSAPVEKGPIHPIDIAYGIDTGGVLGLRELRSGTAADRYNADYGPCQPSIIRRAIGLIPDIEHSTFVDYGCGKGRALAVASEFPFREVVGIELSPSLAAIARKNADVIRSGFPERPPIRIIERDAAEAPLPDGQLVIYMFHPFFEKIMKTVVNNIREFATRAPGNRAFIVYYNPVLARLYDRCEDFERWFAEEIPYDPSEMEARNFAVDQGDTVVIWQTRHAAGMSKPHPNASVPVLPVTSGWRVGLGQAAGTSPTSG